MGRATRVHLSIGDAWREYRRMCAPDDACEEQLADTKEAFYSGVMVAFEMMHDLANHRWMSENAKRCRVESLRRETMLFADFVIQNGHAPGD